MGIYLSVVMENQSVTSIVMLSHCRSLFDRYTPWKQQKTLCCLMFSGGIEMDDLNKPRRDFDIKCRNSHSEIFRKCLLSKIFENSFKKPRI